MWKKCEALKDYCTAGVSGKVSGYSKGTAKEIIGIIPEIMKSKGWFDEDWRKVIED